MPYADRKLRTRRRKRHVELLEKLSPGFLPRPFPGRLMGPAFRRPLTTFAAFLDYGEIAGGKPKISRAKLRELLAAEFDGRFSSTAALRPAGKFDDAEYYVPTPEEVQQVIDHSATRTTAWETEIYDCEDFAYALRADFARNRYNDRTADRPFAVGILWGEFPRQTPHVVNVAAVYDAGQIKVRLIDTSLNKPQPSDPQNWPVVDYIVI